MESKVTTAVLRQRGRRADNVAAGEATTGVGEVTKDIELDISSARVETLAAKDGVTVVDDTFRVAGAAGRDARGAVTAVLVLAPSDVCGLRKRGTECRKSEDGLLHDCWW